MSGGAFKVAIGVCFGTNCTFRATNEIAEARAAAAARAEGDARRGGESNRRSVPKDYILRLIDDLLSLNETCILTIF